MFCFAFGAAIDGIDARMIRAEVDCSDGLPLFDMVGFLASEVREARERVRISVKNSGFYLPPKRITVNLAPADIRKEGSGFDLPIAAALLAASGYIRQSALETCVLVGELGLEGTVRAVTGVLPIVYAARGAGFARCYVPAENVREGTLVQGIEVVGVRTLSELAAWLEGGKQVAVQESEPADEAGSCKSVELAQELAGGAGDPVSKETAREQAGGRTHIEGLLDFADVRGQRLAKRAIEIAAAGRHNLLLIGPPGSGKTMLARRIPSVLPPLSTEECLELTKLYSVAGRLSPEQGLVQQRPFRAPHHTATTVSLTGGGRTAAPGELSLAAHGVLFLDELPEFSRAAVEVLRQPLEEKRITVTRFQACYTFPANFMLVAAMNPCPCGQYPDRTKCTCPPGRIRQYVGKLSQAILDRIDLCVECVPVDYRQLSTQEIPEASAEIRARIVAADCRQRARYDGMDCRYNAELSGGALALHCRLDTDARQLLEQTYDKFRLSARAYHRVLRVARTVADLDGADQIETEHLQEALLFRGLDKKYFMEDI